MGGCNDVLVRELPREGPIGESSVVQARYVTNSPKPPATSFSRVARRENTSTERVESSATSRSHNELNCCVFVIFHFELPEGLLRTSSLRTWFVRKCSTVMVRNVPATGHPDAFLL